MEYLALLSSAYSIEHKEKKMLTSCIFLIDTFEEEERAPGDWGMDEYEEEEEEEEQAKQVPLKEVSVSFCNLWIKQQII